MLSSSADKKLGNVDIVRAIGLTSGCVQMVYTCCHDETWSRYGTSVELGINVTIGFANQTLGICCDVVGVCGHVVIATSVGVVASVGFVAMLIALREMQVMVVH